MTVSGSFRDPAGRVFTHGGSVLREVRQVYRGEYDLLMGYGLYEHLIREGLLVAHEEITGCPVITADTYKILKPVKIPFISYLYEWKRRTLSLAISVCHPSDIVSKSNTNHNATGLSLAACLNM